MVQGAGLVNVVVKLNKAYFDDAGTRLIGDGATADDVFPLEAANLAKAGSLLAASDVKILETDFETFVKSLEQANRG